jgi:hypothetical protein
VNIPDQLLKVYVFIANDRFITILKEVAMAAMAEVVSDGVAGEKAPHELG